MALLSGVVTTAMALFTVFPTTAGGVAGGSGEVVGGGERGGEALVTLMPIAASGGVERGGGEVVGGGLQGSPGVFHAEAARAGGTSSRSSTPRPPRRLAWQPLMSVRRR